MSKPAPSKAPELRLAARRALLGSQSQKGGELARAGEAGRILNGRRHRRGDDRAEAGNAHQPARRFIPLRKLCDGVLKPRNRVVEIRNCTTSGANTSHTSNEIVSSQASISLAGGGRVWALRRDHANLG
jgi:hypothetical protein